jgi:hypothetical protein
LDWIKQWIREDLEGPIRFDLSPAERGVYYDLRLLAGRCNKAGKLVSENNTPFSETYIAGVLNIDRRLLRNCLQKCTALGLLRCNQEEGICDLHWTSTQSDYNRQKPYRHKPSESRTDSDPDKYIKGKYGHLVQR